MSPKALADYATFRRSMFDPKGDLDPIPFAAREEDLLKAARVMGAVYNLLPLRGGSFNTAYRFDTAEGSYVLRVPVDERLAPGLLVEEWAANAAQSAGIKTAIPLITDTSRYVAPFSFQILPYVEDNGSTSVNGKGLANIHLDGYGPIDPRTLGTRPRGLFDTWQDYLTVRLDDHIAKCVQIGAMTTNEAEQVWDAILALDDLDVDSVLVHGDLSPRNVIGDTIIDWDGAIAGDPAWDYASIMAFEADAEHYVNPKLHQRIWTYYLRIVIARTVHRHRFQIPENPVYPKASARIQLALSRLS